MKKYIIGFIVGIIVSSIGVYAITSSTVTYHDTTVDQALDTLYNNVGKVNLDRISFSANSYQGEKIIATTSSINLTTGNYIVIGMEAYSSPVASDPGTTNGGPNSLYPDINQNTDTCTQLGARSSIAIPTTTFDNKYQRLFVRTRLWKCSFNEATTVTITENNMGSTHTNLPLSVIVEAIKLD